AKQQTFKAQRDALQTRLDTLKTELDALPDPTILREEAEAIRMRLAIENIEKDWRTESFDDIRRFLHYLFGDNPKNDNLGIYIRMEQGQYTAEVRARLQLQLGDFMRVDEGGESRWFHPDGDPAGTPEPVLPSGRCIPLRNLPGLTGTACGRS